VSKGPPRSPEQSSIAAVKNGMIDFPGHDFPGHDFPKAGVRE
jgi:hypothetical protein